MRKRVKKSKITLIFLYILVIATIIFSIISFIMADSVSALLRTYLTSEYVVIFCFAIILILLLLVTHILHNNKRKIGFVILTVILLCFSLGINYISYFTISINSSLDNATDKTQEITTNIKILTLNSMNINEIEQIDTLGFLSNKNDYTGNAAPNNYAKENKLTKNASYQDYNQLLYGLLNSEVSAIALPENYSTLYVNNEKLSNEVNNLVVLDDYAYTYSTELASRKLEHDKPLTILIAGSDSEVTSDSNGLYDVIILITFDPSNGNAVISSIPRDSTLYSPCIGANDKVTHNGSYGTACLIETLETSFDLTIDYFLALDFESVIEIVDFLGGVTIDNPFGDVYLQDQYRNRNKVFVPGGTSVLNGEQALAYVRNRKQSNTTTPIDATVRSQNQVQMIMAILEQMKSINFVGKLPQFIELISKHTQTNFPVNDLTAITNLAKEVLDNELSMKTITLEGVDTRYNSPLSTIPLYGYLPYQDSMEYVSKYHNMIYKRQYENFNSTFSLDGIE